MKYTYSAEKLPEVICEAHPEWVDIYNAAWKTVFKNIEYPSGKGWLPQIACIPGSYYTWQWDSCFMTFMTRYSNGSISAMNNLDNLYRLQREDGYMSMAYVKASEEPAFGERINPPIFAWAEWEYFLMSGDDSRFLKIMPRLVNYYQWIKSNRRRVNGLYWFEDCGSSGMDNSPRSGYHAANLAGSDVCFIDLSCQQALSALYIAKIAARLGNEEAANLFRKEHRELAELINKEHWCERHGFYFDLFARDAAGKKCNYIGCKTAAAFWTILSEVASEEQVRRLVEHLVNPEEFMTLHPIPSLSKDDPNYEPLGEYWLGGVWPPINYMLVKGLSQRNYEYLAREIAVKHLEAMVNVMVTDRTCASIWECYSPEFMRPSTYKDLGVVRPDYVGWSGLGPIAMLMENIFGFEFDAVNNCITWNIGTVGKHGVKNLLFNNRKVSLIMDKWSSNKGKSRICVETSDIIQLKLKYLGRPEYTGNRYSLEPGKHNICT